MRVRTNYRMSKIVDWLHQRTAIDMPRFLTKSFFSVLTPLLAPWEERIQTVAIVVTLFLLTSTVVSYCIAACLLLTRYWLPIVIYGAWIYLDRSISHAGGRRMKIIQQLGLWKQAADYFPVRLVKTVDLPTDKNYLFCVYPHGVLSISSFLNFCTDACNFNDLFPGVDRYRITLNSNFYAPFTREFYLSTGNCSSSERSIVTLLTKSECTACVLVVGGASEALNAFPGGYRITVNRRRGFVRLALQTGAAIVPVISFGENDIFDQVRGGKIIRNLQEWVRHLTGVSPVLILGRGLFEYSFGLIPFRRPVTTVVGRPIYLPKIASPCNEVIDEYKTKFVVELQQLFDENKGTYDQNGVKAKLTVE